MGNIVQFDYWIHLSP